MVFLHFLSFETISPRLAYFSLPLSIVAVRSVPLQCSGKPFFLLDKISPPSLEMTSIHLAIATIMKPSADSFLSLGLNITLIMYVVTT